MKRKEKANVLWSHNGHFEIETVVGLGTPTESFFFELIIYYKILLVPIEENRAMLI